jgi:ubiquinone/menaquinone biosynthesis C-methylase UbiE
MIEDKTPDMDQEARLLAVMNPLTAPVIDTGIQALHLPPGSRGLDVGCGVGLQATRLAEAVGPAGHVTGLDVSPRMLGHARRLTEQSGLAKRVSFQEGDMNRLPFADNSFDWLWSADCAGYAPAAEPLRLLNELTRVVRPGGIVAILFWSSQMLLPGYPVLEARLNATSAGIAPFGAETAPDRHYLLTLGWLRRAGLVNTWAETFIRTVFAPIESRIREALVALLKMRWGDAESELSRSEQAEYRRLCQPESPAFILNRPDYYAFFTYSLFCGQVVR